MTGNAGFMGARRLSELCGQLEDTAREGTADECGELLGLVETEYDRAVAELEEMLATRRGT